MMNVMHRGWKFLTGFLLILLIVLTFWLRFQAFGKNPIGLYWDEAAILVDARSIAQTGHDMHGRPWYQVIYPSYGDYKLPVYIWLAGASVKFLGSTEVAVRLPSALAGLLTIGISAWLVMALLENEISKISNRSFLALAGAATALILALSPWSILFSRTGFEANLAQAFLAISILCMVLSQKKWWLIYLSPIFGLLATYTYFSARYVWLGVFVIYTVLVLWLWPLLQKKNSAHYFKLIRHFALILIVPIMMFFVGLWPMLHSPLYAASNTFRLSTDSVLQNLPDVLQSNSYRELAGNSRIDRVIFFRWWLTGKKLLANYSDNMSLNFLFVTGDPNPRHGTGYQGLFFLIFLPFFAVGWYVIFRKHPTTFLLLISWWLLALLPASVPNTTPHALRSLNALVPLAAVIGIGFTYSVKYLADSRIHLILKYIVSGCFLLFFFGNLLQFSNYYFTEYPTQSAASWQAGYKQLAQLVFSIRKSNEPVFVLSFDDRFYLWLLLYGPYSAQQIQTFPDANFQIRDFANIYTEHLPNEITQETLLVGSIDQVNQYTSNHRVKVSNTQQVIIPNQTPYEVVSISPLNLK